MPQGPDGKTIIIVKKVVGHGGHHGGAWKVAYADFVTSMMCLFLVLWLVNSASVTTRERIASYFKRPGIFDEGSGTPLETGGPGILSDAFAPPSDGNSQTAPTKNYYDLQTEGGLKKEGFSGGIEGKEGTGEKPGIEALKNARRLEEKRELEQVASEIQRTVEEDKRSIAGFMGQMTVKLDQRGLHLEIMDSATASMFQSGQAGVLPEAQAELEKIAKRLAQLPNPIDIEGHTDAKPFHRADYDNWDLATARANAARRIFTQAGVKDAQIARVVGYAAQRPKVRENPLDPTNRRISISLRYTDQAANVLSGKNLVETNPQKANESVAGKAGAAVPAGAGKADSSTPRVGFASVPIGVLPSVEKGDEKESAETPPNVKVDPQGVEQNIGPSSKTTLSNGLKMEMNTTLPEGATLQPGSDSGQHQAPATGQVWKDKPLIFDGKDPFSEH